MASKRSQPNSNFTKGLIFEPVSIAHFFTPPSEYYKSTKIVQPLYFNIAHIHLSDSPHNNVVLHSRYRSSRFAEPTNRFDGLAVVLRGTQCPPRNEYTRIRKWVWRPSTWAVHATRRVTLAWISVGVSVGNNQGMRFSLVCDPRLDSWCLL